MRGKFHFKGFVLKNHGRIKGITADESGRRQGDQCICFSTLPELNLCYFYLIIFSRIDGFPDKIGCEQGKLISLPSLLLSICIDV